jgi:hypothetical protein
MYSSRLRWAIVNEDRHCGARRRRAMIPWSIEVSYLVQHGPARPACGTLREFAGPLLEHAGLCGTLRDHAGPCWTICGARGA